MFIFIDTEFTQAMEARFWNSGGTQIAIVASITKGMDWAAYIGADKSWTEAETLAHALAYGTKLSEEDARHFFPNVELPYRG